KKGWGSQAERDWRDATPEEAKAIRCNELAEIYSQRDIRYCQSMLVSELLQKGGEGSGLEGFAWDNVENLYVDACDWTIEQCRQWLEDEGYDLPDSEDEEDWQEAVNDNASPQEVYEWWLVSDWLADRLKEIGEPVLVNDYGQWWGRCTTGQGYLMDGTLQKVAARFVD